MHINKYIYFRNIVNILSIDVVFSCIITKIKKLLNYLILNKKKEKKNYYDFTFDYIYIKLHKCIIQL